MNRRQLLVGGSAIAASAVATGGCGGKATEVVRPAGMPLVQSIELARAERIGAGGVAAPDLAV